MTWSKEIQEQTRNKIVDMYQSGKCYKAISKALGLQRTTVRAIIHRWRKLVTVVNLPRSGWSTKITPRAQWRFIQEVIKEPCTTSKELQASLASIKVSVHDSTIRKRLGKNGTHRRVPRENHCWPKRTQRLVSHLPKISWLSLRLEKLIRDYICSVLPASLDPLQFAYRSNRSTDDAIAFTLHSALSHLENKNTYVRMIFVDYSSAFNTIVPATLVAKLQTLGLNRSLCSWILDFLTDRSQVVRMGNNTSSPLILNTGAPQGCVLSPLLYSGAALGGLRGLKPECFQ